MLAPQLCLCCHCVVVVSVYRTQHTRVDKHSLQRTQRRNTPLDHGNLDTAGILSVCMPPALQRTTPQQLVLQQPMHDANCDAHESELYRNQHHTHPERPSAKLHQNGGLKYCTKKLRSGRQGLLTQPNNWHRTWNACCLKGWCTLYCHPTIVSAASHATSSPPNITKGDAYTKEPVNWYQTHPSQPHPVARGRLHTLSSHTHNEAINTP
jgi:hypothetical protein